MQIVIPMSGFGERFRKAGYSIPKPLIEVDGKPIIGHVIDLFPSETDFIFICNKDHLEDPNYRMKEILNELCPTGRIVGISPHKLGPINAVLQAKHLLDPNQAVVVNYCDFTCYWDWSHFKRFVIDTNCDGAIPAYKGFHPHTLGNTNYAYIKEKNGSKGWVEDIQEKKPYTDLRMEEYASSGTYFFSKAKNMIDAFERVINENLNVGGEFYVSLAYKPMLSDGKKIVIYPLQHFMQWGTPEDLDEYNSWSRTFKTLIADTNSLNPSLKNSTGSVVIPMAGLGKRFSDEGYSLAKPLIPVSGHAMALQAIKDLPEAQCQSLVLRSNMPGLAGIEASIKEHLPNAILTLLPSVTEGQACTAIIGLDAIEKSMPSVSTDDLQPVTFGTCDNGVLFNSNSYQILLDNPMVDVIVWGTRGHPNAIRKPEMFGWIDADSNGFINSISVKTPLKSPSTDPIVIGTFTFKNFHDAKKVIQSLIARDGRINGELYLDSCINDAISMGLRCYLFEVDSFISWGTPNDLKTFEYWQSCFHKWKGHPYRLELDKRVNPSDRASLATRYETLIPPLPENCSSN